MTIIPAHSKYTNLKTNEDRINYISTVNGYEDEAAVYHHPKILDEIKVIAKTPEEFYCAFKLYSHMPESMTHLSKMKAIQLNLSFRKNAKIPNLLKDYKIEFTKPEFNSDGFCINIHTESGMQIGITTKESNLPIATANFFFTIEHNKIHSRINNIQGEEREYQKHTSQSLQNLSEKLNENWRIAIARTIREYCDSKNIKTILELPPMHLSGTSKSEYERQIRQYIQTALKAGFKIENIDIKNITEHPLRTGEHNNLKQKYKEILKNKHSNIAKEKNRQERRELKNKIPKKPKPIKRRF